MAEITIRLDTTHGEDRRLLSLLFGGPATVTPEPGEPERPADPAAEVPKSKGGRPRKAAPEAPQAPPSPPAPPAESEAENDVFEGAPANILEVNNALRRLIDGGMPTSKLKEVLLAATDNKYGSANQAANAGDQAALNQIAEAVKLLEAA